MIAKRVVAPKNTPTFLGIANYISNAAKQPELPNDMRDAGQVDNLVSYIADRKGAAVRVTNCNFDTVESAVKEIQSVQSNNTRSKREKTYHLVVSLAEGEKPSAEILEQIEKEIVSHIGFGEHQRISALHTNTDNWHIHIAINKVHPVSYRNVEPYYDHFKLREKCQELEIHFGLQQTNGISLVRKPRMNKGRESELHSGIESLVTWISNNVAEEIRQNLQTPEATWKNLHKLLNRNGLLLRSRGAGFVLQDFQSGLTVKASTVDRGFAKKSIEQILGPYEEQRAQYPAEKAYEAGPRQEQSSERDLLWNQYTQERQEIIQKRSELFAALKESRKSYLYRALTDIKNRKRETYRSALLGARQKKEVSAALQLQRLKVLEKAKDFWQQHKTEIESQHPHCTWTTFLQNQVRQGNEVALSMLRQKGQNGFVEKDLMEQFKRENEQIVALKERKICGLLDKEKEDLQRAHQGKDEVQVSKNINEKYQQLRELADAKYSVMSLQEYLVREARKGNQAATVLVGGVSDLREEGGNFIKRAEPENYIAKHLSFNVDKTGRINYKIKGNRIVDTGKRIFPESQDKQVLLAALQLAVGKYGKTITVKGSDQFINDVKQTAKGACLRVKINGEQIKPIGRGAEQVERG